MLLTVAKVELGHLVTGFLFHLGNDVSPKITQIYEREKIQKSTGHPKAATKCLKTTATETSSQALKLCLFKTETATYHLSDQMTGMMCRAKNYPAWLARASLTSLID